MKVLTRRRIILIAALCGCGLFANVVAAQVFSGETVHLLGDVPGIKDPTQSGWPRIVEGLNGPVEIPRKPQRVLTVSLGHDEVTYALVPAQRVVAVGRFTKDLGYSNVANISAGAGIVGRDVEQIISFAPDVVVASPFTSQDLIRALNDIGIPTVQTKLHNDLEGRINDIMLMGYLYGEEQRAIRFGQELRDRTRDLQQAVNAPAAGRPRVMPTARWAERLYTAGAGSTEAAIIELAAGVNVAVAAGLSGNPVIDLEAIVLMNPEVIIITQPADSASVYRDFLLHEPALAEVVAIKTGRVYQVDPKLYTTLSFWNLQGAEDLARLLWPDRGVPPSRPFSMP